MKKYTYLLITAVTLLAIALPFLLTQSRQECSASKRIAIFTPTTHLALEEIEQGFKETLQNYDSSQKYIFKTFNANGNKTLLRAQAEEIVAGSYDLIFTIGAGCSQTIAQLLHTKNIHTPHIFGGVEGPGFAQSLHEMNSSSTGAYVQADYEKEIELLHKVKPDIKNILLVYDPGHGTGLEKIKDELEAYCAAYATTLHAVEIFQTSEIQQKVPAFLPDMDVVLVLTDNTVVAGIDALITLCNRYKVTLCASDLSSGKRGAALAYGITEYESGSQAAQKAAFVLVEHEAPYNLPIGAVSNFRFEINRKTFGQQNVTLSAFAGATHG